MIVVQFIVLCGCFVLLLARSWADGRPFCITTTPSRNVGTHLVLACFDSSIHQPGMRSSLNHLHPIDPSGGVLLCVVTTSCLRLTVVAALANKRVD